MRPMIINFDPYSGSLDLDEDDKKQLIIDYGKRKARNSDKNEEKEKHRKTR